MGWKMRKIIIWQHKLLKTNLYLFSVQVTACGECHHTFLMLQLAATNMDLWINGFISDCSCLPMVHYNELIFHSDCIQVGAVQRGKKTTGRDYKESKERDLKSFMWKEGLRDSSFSSLFAWILFLILLASLINQLCSSSCQYTGRDLYETEKT